MPALMLDWHIHRYDEVTSTQDIAADMARAGCVEGTVVVTKSQTAGRGRIGNVWQSHSGNLLTSIVLRPDIEPAQAGQYSFLTAVALNRMLSEMLKDSHSILNKWPNDRLVDGKKIAGILLESVLDGPRFAALVIGMGVNVASSPEDKTSLTALGAAQETSETVLVAFLANLKEVLLEFDQDGFAPFHEEWLDHAMNLHKTITVRLPSGTLDGVFEGLEVDGALRLRLANGDIKVIHSGEVFFG